MMSQLRPGQRFMSETEPELGLGILLEIGEKQLVIEFRATETTRIYGVKSAPLKRVLFEVGDRIKSRTGEKFIVANVEIDNELAVYWDADNQNALKEEELDDHLSFNKPEEKLFKGMVDSEKLFQLRSEAISHWMNYETNPSKGLLGGRIGLIPHQFYVATKVLEQLNPRVLLADEVGLGKTIEAGLILQKLLVTGRAERVLVIVPDSLVYQWFFELHRKFQLGFRAINQETPPDGPENPFIQNQLIILSFGLLKGSSLAQKLLSQAEFDVVVVDEAHRYQPKHKKNRKEELSENDDYTLIADICERTPSCLLLTATPEQLGLEGHFYRLKLLDPDRYSDFELFKKEVIQYGEIADFVKNLYEEKTIEGDGEKLKSLIGEELYARSKKVIEEKNDQSLEVIIQDIVDRHGTGRIFFRNTRHMLAQEYNFFPKRILLPYPFEEKSKGETFNEKCFWLCGLLKELETEKILLICHSKEMILRIERYIKENLVNPRVALFHSELSLMARDRQAAYFADPKGAQVLLCTEIGSEGRNFEFSHHLVLFDLPKKPDLLEQRIGRLDRIGQKADIKIHVPYGKGTTEEWLFHLYHEGLNSFQEFSTVGTPTVVHFHQGIHSLIEGQLSEDEVKSLVTKVREFRLNLEKELRESRDYMIEMNSFNSKKAHELCKSIRDEEKAVDLKNFMEKIFDSFGVDVEELNNYATYIKPNDNMFIPYFPHLNSEGQTITFDRREALEREDYQFMTWDHPMVREIVQLIVSESYGSMTVATRKEGGGKKSFLECTFLLRSTAPNFLEVGRFLPPTPLRILIDKEGVDYAEKWDKQTLDGLLVEADNETLAKAVRIPKDFVKSLLKKAEGLAQEKSQIVRRHSVEKIQTHMSHEIERLMRLSEVNSHIDKSEVELLKALKVAMLKGVEEASLSLDSLRLIL